MIKPSNRFFQEPKSGEPEPPPNDVAPTERRENPIEVTTLAATIGDTIFLQYLAKSPKVPSTRPPTSIAPTTLP